MELLLGSGISNCIYICTHTTNEMQIMHGKMWTMKKKRLDSLPTFKMKVSNKGEASRRNHETKIIVWAATCLTYVYIQVREVAEFANHQWCVCSLKAG